MGLYDSIKYEMDCPKCGAKVTSFQSKDGECMLGELEYWEVDNFYSSCNKCNLWIEFNRIVPVGPVPLSDYKMSTHQLGEARHTA